MSFRRFAAFSKFFRLCSQEMARVSSVFRCVHIFYGTTHYSLDVFWDSHDQSQRRSLVLGFAIVNFSCAKPLNIFQVPFFFRYFCPFLSVFDINVLFCFFRSAPSGEVSAVFEGFNYTFHIASTTYAQARTGCENRSSFLADILSKDENDFLVALFPSRPGNPYYLDSAWIGYRDVIREGVFVWDRTGRNGTFTGWHTNITDQEDEPNNRPNNQAGEGADCTLLTPAYSTGEWEDYPCDASFFSFICKKGEPKTENRN